MCRPFGHRGVKGFPLVRRAVLVGMCLSGAASPAAAQDVRVDVKPIKIEVKPIIDVKPIKIDISPVVVREIQRIVRDGIDIGTRRDFAAAIHEAVGAVSWLGRRLPAFDGSAQDRALRAELPPQKETKTLQLGAEGSLELRNISGEISITAGSGRTATVEITKVARGRTELDAKTGLEQVVVDIAERPDRVVIETRYPRTERERGQRPWSVSVSYRVTAPAGTKLNIANISGTVTTKGIKGDQAFDVTSGALHVSDAGRVTSAKVVSGPLTLTGVTSDGGLDVSNISGDVTLQQVKARRIAINVVSGNITGREVSAEDVRVTTMNGIVELTGPLTQRGRYDLQSYSGIVRLLVSGAVGFDLKADTFSGQVQVDPPLAAMAGGSRRSIRGTIGDGSASVTLHTFSGNIIVVTKR